MLSRFHNELLILFSAILLSLSIAPSPLGFLSYIAFIPLFIILHKQKSKSYAFRLCYLWGFLFSFISLYWLMVIIPTTSPAVLFAYIGLGFYLGIPLWLIYFILRQKWYYAFLIPFIWSGREYLMTLHYIGFPWQKLAYTQQAYLPIIQIAEIICSIGISFWVMLLNVLLYIIFTTNRTQKQKNILATITFICYLSFWIYGYYALRQPLDTSETTKIALIQGNIPQKIKWEEFMRDSTITLYTQLSHNAYEEQSVDLIVLPETAIPCHLLHNKSIRAQIQKIAIELNTYLLVGTPDYKWYKHNREDIPLSKLDTLEFYNSAILFEPDGNIQNKYRKMFPVPGSEKIPFDDVLLILRKINFGEADWDPGDEYTVFNNGKADFSVGICLESAVPNLYREFTKRGAQFLLIITNDAWFLRSLEVYQHLAIGRFRAVECRRSLGRCANTGISSFIDPYGRIIKTLGLEKRGYLIHNLALNNKITFYVKYGDIIGKIGIFVSLMSIIFLLIKYYFSYKKHKES